MVSIWKAPARQRWGFFKLWLKNLHLWRIICLTGELEGECESPDPAKIIQVKIAVYFSQEQDGYFLFFRFRIATIRSPIVKSTINSSYVLIIPTTFRLGLGLGESTSPGSPIKHIILSWCSNFPILNRRNRSHLKCGLSMMSRGDLIRPYSVIMGSVSFDLQYSLWRSQPPIYGFKYYLWFYQRMNKMPVWGG